MNQENEPTDAELQIPPHDVDAEAAVLSAVMIDATAYDKVATLVTAEDFFGEAHRRIFEACASVSTKGAGIDVLLVSGWLRDNGRLAQVGGMAYLTEVVNAAPAVLHVDRYAEIVASKSRLRTLQTKLRALLADSFRPIDDGDTFIDRAEQQVHAVNASKRARTPVHTMPTVITTVFQKMLEASRRVLSGNTGTSTGFEVLDDMTGGLHDGESTILAARPGMGKTAMAMNVACTVAHGGRGVIVFSLEMPNEQLATRALCSAAGVDGRKARTNKFDHSDWSRLTEAASRITKPEHFYLIDQPCGLLEIRSLARARASDMARAEKKLGLIVVDYVQLMSGREGIRSREEAVAENARGLKLIAKELSCPVIVLSQLNRVVETRSDKRPMLSDLRESGAIEEAADCVIGMYRDDYYHEDTVNAGRCELTLLKHRHGPTGTIEVGFSAKTTTFFNLREEAAQ